MEYRVPRYEKKNCRVIEDIEDTLVRLCGSVYNVEARYSTIIVALKY